MKKIMMIVLVALLAIPSIGFAGSASSRWDLFIGGFIKFDMGYADKGTTSDFPHAPRDSYGKYESRAAEYSSLYSAIGETRMWMIVKGPDAWGGKTMGYVEWDFRGESPLVGDYGENFLRMAYMKIDWPNDSILIGRSLQEAGKHGPFGGFLLNYAALAWSLKGLRNEMIMWHHNVSKEWSFYTGIEGNTGEDYVARKLDDFAQSGRPWIEAGINYRSDACGVIGRNPMYFRLGGIVGWENKIYNKGTMLDNELHHMYTLALSGYVPIIPERKGNKTGALGVAGTAFVGKNLGWQEMMPSTAYIRSTDPNGDVNFGYPLAAGGYVQLSYWFTDNLSMHGWFGGRKNSYSTRFLQKDPAASNIMKQNLEYIVNLTYDVNQAMRFGLEYRHVNTKYGNYLFDTSGNIVGDKQGKINSVRIGAFYFF